MSPDDLPRDEELVRRFTVVGLWVQK